jgi:hypothetical protein
MNLHNIFRKESFDIFDSSSFENQTPEIAIVVHQ